VEDHWFQYWKIYFLVNKQNGTIADLWDGVNLKITFRRCREEKEKI
jgi:hypothetical protein